MSELLVEVVEAGHDSARLVGEGGATPVAGRDRVRRRARAGARYL